uniref:Uncharacterized protein n=1 Tax=Glossina pallidipes TaxID=7398 RepID=A0A1B0AAT3_GLOPL
MATLHENINAVSTKEQQQQQQQQQQPPTSVTLFPLKCESLSEPTKLEVGNALRKSKRLLRSLRGHRKDAETEKQKKTSKQLHQMLKNFNINHQQHQQQQQQQQQLANDCEPEAIKQNAKHTLLDDPFLFGIDEDHLDDLVRGSQTNHPNPSLADHVTKYFNLHYNETEANSELQSTISADQDQEEKPALPPKRFQMNSVRKTCPTQNFKLNDNDLEFLNLSLRNRSLPRNVKPFKDPHDINFRFKEENKNNIANDDNGIHENCHKNQTCSYKPNKHFAYANASTTGAKCNHYKTLMPFIPRKKKGNAFVENTLKKQTDASTE